jgi:hypothetical protein
LKFINSNIAKIFALLLASLLFTRSLSAADTLSIRFANPRIEYVAPNNYLAFDIQVISSSNGTYLFSSQIICSVSIADFNTTVQPAFTPGFIAGTYLKPPSGPTYDKYTVTTNWNANKLNIAINHTFQVDANYPASYSGVTTTWQTLGTLRLLLSGTAFNGQAGISFLAAAMNGYQKYASGPSTFLNYNNPNVYVGNDLAGLYLGRIYSGTAGWSQWNGTVNWLTAVNTSVWDILTVPATISNTGSLALALRVHPGASLKVLSGKDLSTSGAVDINGPQGLIISTGASMHSTNP